MLVKKVGAWRGELEAALATLREAVAGEERARVADHHNVTATLADSRGRMAQIASDIAALRRKQGQYVPRSPAVAATQVADGEASGVVAARKAGDAVSAD